MNKYYKVFVYIFLTVIGFTMIFPFLWMLSTSLKTGTDIYSPSIIPKTVTLKNYINVIENSNFLLWFKNSIIVATITTVSVLCFDTLVGYTFSKLHFRGKKLLFIMILSTLMIPTEMLIIPWYMMSTTYGWLNSYWSLLFPGLTSAFGIFMMRQFFMGVPDDILEAGRIDGLTEPGIFLRAAMPMVKPAMSALAIFTFLGNWNAFLWPVIAVDKTDIYTLPVGLAMFSGESYNQWDLVMAAASLATIPVLIIFFFFQKQIIQGIHMTGLKA